MIPTGQLAVLALVALAAGVVDAIGGGGGLLTVPALLACGLPPHLALATNKGQSVFGAGAALARFARAGLVPWRRARWTWPFAFAGALLGAGAVLRVRPELLRPLLLVLLALAALFLVLGRVPEPRPGTRAGGQAVASALALALGVYDGFFGPGTGTFLVLGLALLLRLPLTQASAEAKVINFASNLAALLLFARRGVVVWPVAFPMALGQVLGGWLGAHLTVRGGDRVVRWVVLAVVVALLGKLGGDWMRAG